MHKKRILVAPLNWGLGHATRCIPLIIQLKDQGFEPVLASDGEALALLQQEFPNLESHVLPSYNIGYSKTRSGFTWHLLRKVPHIIKTISAERKMVADLVTKKNISGILSDNRWGVRHPKVPSVFVTHQLQVLSGSFTRFSSKIQQKYIEKFNACWVPDVADEPSLSGKMGHINGIRFPVQYLGMISRLNKEVLPIQFDIAIILSGPEPQRGMLQEILERELMGYDARILLVKGIVENLEKEEIKQNWTVCNFLTSAKLQEYLNSSTLVICRPGYTSLMDLAALQKNAFLIPTPGQPEQEYLGKRLKENMIAAGCSQKEFTIEKLKEVPQYEGLGEFTGRPGPDISFALFQRE